MDPTTKTAMKKKVTFSDTVHVFSTWSDSEYERNGIEWRLAAVDRDRFRRRISVTAKILDPVMLSKYTVMKNIYDIKEK